MSKCVEDWGGGSLLKIVLSLHSQGAYKGTLPKAEKIRHTAIEEKTRRGVKDIHIEKEDVRARELQHWRREQNEDDA